MIDSRPDVIGPPSDPVRLKTSADSRDKCVSNLRWRCRLSSQGRKANDLTDKTVIYLCGVAVRSLERNQTLAQGHARMWPVGFCSWTELTELLPASRSGLQAIATDGEEADVLPHDGREAAAVG